MRAQPPSWRDDEDSPPHRTRRLPQQRCPYLEQILRDRTMFGMLNRFKADCHVDHRTHHFTGRHPVPPCITDPQTCHLYREKWAEERHLIDRYRD